MVRNCKHRGPPCLGSMSAEREPHSYVRSLISGCTRLITTPPQEHTCTTASPRQNLVWPPRVMRFATPIALLACLVPSADAYGAMLFSIGASCALSYYYSRAQALLLGCFVSLLRSSPAASLRRRSLESVFRTTRRQECPADAVFVRV